MSLSLVEQLAARAIEYLTDPPRRPNDVVNFATPEQLLERFRESVAIPLQDDAPAAEDDALVAAADLVIDHSVHTSHPRFLNQNFAGPDPIAVVGDWLGAALNTTGATFEAAPVFTLMESAVLDKLARVAGYVDSTPGGGSTITSNCDGGPPSIRVPIEPPGLFCPGGSTGTLYGLQLARHRCRPDITRVGSTGERLTLFVSDAGHYAAAKSAALMGIGTDAVIKVDTDDAGAMIPAELEAAVTRSIATGAVPFAVVATAGTTVSSAFDDLQATADICERHGLWLHVDGCYGGSALFSPNHRHLLDGIERSDSFVWNLHKMMGMTQQCTALLVKEPQQLGPCFAGRADYLFQPDKQHAEFDSGDRTFQCARRIDVLKLWLAWKHHGDAGFAARVDHADRMAEHCRSIIAGSDGAFAPVISGRFTNVVFAWVPPDLRPLEIAGRSVAELSEPVRRRLHALPPAIKARMQHEGTAMVGFQPVGGLNTFRMLFMSPTVSTGDVDAVMTLIDRYGREL